MPTQLVLVPMLFLLPPAAVPACVAAARCWPTLSTSLRRREHPERLVASSADAWYAVGPASSSRPRARRAPELDDWGVLALALTAQCATDLLTATAREWLGRGHRPGRAAARDRQRST